MSTKQGRASKQANGKQTSPRKPGAVDRSALLASLPMLRNSERGTLKACEFRWDLAYNQHLKPQREMPALRFGSLVHTALAVYYKPGIRRGTHPAIAFEIAYEEDQKRNREIFGMKVDEDERWINALELGVAMLNNYVDEYGKDERWEVLVTEYPFQTLVSHESDGMDVYGHSWKQGEPWFWYVGVLDGVWRDRRDKSLWIPDHKTTSGLGDSKLKYLQLDDQAGSYWSWGIDALIEAKLLKQNQRLNGMLYNFLRKAMPDERASRIVKGKRLYLNQNGTVSAKQPSPYFMRQPIYRDEYDRAEAKRRSIVDFQRITMFREGTLDLSKSPGMFTCPTCAMRDICELHETGADYNSFIKQTTESWDPYAEHEVLDGR